jgi:hypothetical protein
LVSGVEGDAAPAGADVLAPEPDVPDVAPAIEVAVTEPIDTVAGDVRDDALEDLLAGAAPETPGSADQMGEFPTPTVDPVAVETNPAPSFLTPSGPDDVGFAFDLEGDDDVTDAGSDSPSGDESRSSVRRFLFGKKEKEPDEDFFGTKKDRDFEW